MPVARPGLRARLRSERERYAASPEIAAAQAALAARLRDLWRDQGAGERALAVVRERYAPAAVAAQLRQVYGNGAG